MRLAGIIAALVIAADQVSKYIVVHRMRLDLRHEIEVFPPFLNFRMAWNRGVNFGLFADEGDMMRWILIAVAVGISLWVWLWARKMRGRVMVRVSAGLLVGGALGNVIDRLLYGAVADFLNMSCCGIDNPFAFNIADVAIFAGAIGLVFLAGGDDGNDRRKSRAKTP